MLRKNEPPPIIFLCRKDVQRLTRRGIKFSHALIRCIKDINNKGKDDFITIHEFCDYTKMSLQAALAALGLL